MRKLPTPRQIGPGAIFAGQTWLEPEELTYPSGGFYRRAFVRVLENEYNPSLPDLPYGALRVVRCSVPDTYFSIPARLRIRGKTVRGFICYHGEPREIAFFPEAPANPFARLLEASPASPV
jgi:hypothetical protein